MDFCTVLEAPPGREASQFSVILEISLVNQYNFLAMCQLQIRTKRFSFLFVLFFNFFFKVHWIQMISTEVTEDSQKCMSADYFNPGLLQ